MICLPNIYLKNRLMSSNRLSEYQRVIFEFSLCVHHTKKFPLKHREKRRKNAFESLKIDE
jgi:hypothetical protein